MSNSANFYLERGADTSQTHNQVVGWLNEAAMTTDSALKLSCLNKSKEVILNSTLDLLDNFLEELLNFQNDRHPQVRCFVLQFIEDACKKDHEVLPKVMATVQMLLSHQSALVQKKAILVATQLYKQILLWMSSAKVTEVMETTWEEISEIKKKIICMIDNDNDGIRTVAVKFLETVILVQSYPESESLERKDDFSLQDVPMTLKFARRRKLEEEANSLFEVLIKFHGSTHVSSLNLMTCMGSLVQIAKMRPQFMPKVVAALENLNSNLPPTLFKSQVSSVRKQLRTKLLSLLKQPAAYDLHPNITSLLTDLGTTPAEINRHMPKSEEIRRVKAKRVAEFEEASQIAKRARLDLNYDKIMDIDDEDDEEETTKVPETSTDATEKFIFERLTPEMTASLVCHFIPRLPSTMPPHFSAVYAPITAAGTPQQIRQLSRLLAAQISAANAASAINAYKAESGMPTPVPPVIRKKERTVTKQEDERPIRPKNLKLSEITRPLEVEQKMRILDKAVYRILNAEKNAAEGGVTTIRQKIITSFASTFHPRVRHIILNFIMEDIKRRMDLALCWLYEEHSFIQGFNRNPSLFRDKRPDDNYNELLSALISHVSERAKLDSKDREILLNRLYLEVPVITETALQSLKNICCDETKAEMGLKLLEELILKRPPRQIHLINVLLVQTSHDNQIIRNEALERAIALYKRSDMSSIIEEYSILYLGFLKHPVPPDVLFGPDRGRPVKADAWTEDTIRNCVCLFLAIVPFNEKLIHELARVYVATSSEVKRVVLRLLEQPVRGMGMHSPELLALLEDCPKGAETLITRIIHLLTDKATPSEELVSRVRDLYNTRVSDVRFLIPVLTGLTKDEVIAALPKLLKLTPAVVKEVFTRLLSCNPDGSCAGPLTPADLLVALHVIDTSQVDLKLVMKATSLCFAERHIYTQDVLAVALQTLVELNPLPTLLMRSVIQSLTIYPRLIGFTMNVLQRLIQKQVWRQKKVWEGFIKCCQRTKPQSFQVLLQLPPAQLIDVFMECPELQKPLHDHVMAFTEHQRKSISKSTMEILRGNKLVILDEEGDYPSFVPPAQPATLPVVEIKKETQPDDPMDETPAPAPVPAPAVTA